MCLGSLYTGSIVFTKLPYDSGINKCIGCIQDVHIYVVTPTLSGMAQHYTKVTAKVI